MNADTLVIIVGFFSLIIGAFIGIKLFKFYSVKLDKKIIENAKDVLSGKRENKIKIDGQDYDANKFRVRDEDDKEIIIDLQGGGTVQDGRREESSAGIEEVQEHEVEAVKEVSGGSGEKKRTSRVRSVLSRFRRFG